jgi:hypothetical protein
MVVQVGVPTVEVARVRCVVGMVALDRVHHLAHGQNDPAQLNQLLADAIGPLLDLTGHGLVVEKAVLKRLDHVVHVLDGLEVAIHDDVEQTMQQRARAQLQQVSVVVPTLHHLVHVESGVGTHRDDAIRQDEGGDAGEMEAGLEYAEPVVPPNLETGGRVHRDKSMSCVPRGLRTLTSRDGILHRVRIQGQLIGQLQEERVVGLAQIEPHQRAIILQMVGDLLEREVLDLEPAISPQSGARAIPVATGHGTSVHRRTGHCGRQRLPSARSKATTALKLTAPAASAAPKLPPRRALIIAGLLRTGGNRPAPQPIDRHINRSVDAALIASPLVGVVRTSAQDDHAEMEAKLTSIDPGGTQ